MTEEGKLETPGTGHARSHEETDLLQRNTNKIKPSEPTLQTDPTVGEKSFKDSLFFWVPTL